MHIILYLYTHGFSEDSIVTRTDFEQIFKILKKMMHACEAEENVNYSLLHRDGALKKQTGRGLNS